MSLAKRPASPVVSVDKKTRRDDDDDKDCIDEYVMDVVSGSSRLYGKSGSEHIKKFESMLSDEKATYDVSEAMVKLYTVRAAGIKRYKTVVMKHYIRNADAQTLSWKDIAKRVRATESIELLGWFVDHLIEQHVQL